MKTSAINLWITLLVSGYLLISCPITLPLNKLFPTQHPEYTLKQVVEGKTCNESCWQSIVPGISTVDDVDTLLRESNTEPFIVHFMQDGSPMSYEWEYAETLLLPDESERKGGILVSFSEAGVVLQVTLVVDVCVTTVVETFDLPETIILDGLGRNYLYYPDLDLFFGTTDGRVDLIVRTPAGEFPRGDELSLESISSVLDEDCLDEFSH